MRMEFITNDWNRRHSRFFVRCEMESRSPVPVQKVRKSMRNWQLKRCNNGSVHGRNLDGSAADRRPRGESYETHFALRADSTPDRTSCAFAGRVGDSNYLGLPISPDRP